MKNKILGILCLGVILIMCSAFVLAEGKIMPPFMMAVDDRAPASDVMLVTDVLSALRDAGYDTRTVGITKLFSEVNALFLGDKVTLAVYKNEAVIIVGATSPASHVVFAVEISTILKYKGVSSRTILDTEVESPDLIDLFVTEPEIVCTDSDGGKNYYKQGIVEITLPGLHGTSEDFCKNSMLYEFTCPSDPNIGQADFDAYDCPYGCQNGACLKAPEIACTDSDGGLDYYEKGVVYGRWAYNDMPSAKEGEKDYCAVGDKDNEVSSCSGTNCYLVEFHCTSTTHFGNTPYTCPYGCQNGACLKAPTEVEEVPENVCANKGYKCTSAIRGCGHYKQMDYSCGTDYVICCEEIPYCGDGVCFTHDTPGYGETPENCPQDCGVPSGKPDLIIKNLKYNKVSAKLATIDFDIVNIGNDNVDDWFAIAVYIDGRLHTHTIYNEQKIGTRYGYDEDAVIPIRPGERYHKHLSNYYWLGTGKHEITVVADRFEGEEDNPLFEDIVDDMIYESNEGNNKATIIIGVSEVEEVIEIEPIEEIPIPTCYDGIWNDGESGVDCGGPCKPCVATIETCNVGCLSDGACLPFGTRIVSEHGEPMFCDLNQRFSLQKVDNQACQNSYECLSNSCHNGRCISIEKEIMETRGILEKILEWLKGFFS